MSRVFITQQAPNFDFSQAEDLGRMVAIWPPNRQAWGDTRHIVDEARRILADFDPDEDYLLPLGDPALMCIAAAEVALIADGRFRVLKWDRRKGDFGGYRVVSVDMEAQPT